MIHHHKFVVFILIALLVGFLVGKFNIGGALKTSVIVADSGIVAPADSNSAYEKGKLWLDKYKVTPQKIADF